MMGSQGPGAAGSSLAREQPGAERSSHEQPSSSGVAMAEASWCTCLLSGASAHFPAHSPSFIMT